MRQALVTAIMSALIILLVPLAHSAETDQHLSPFVLTDQERANLTDEQIALAERILEFLICAIGSVASQNQL